MFEAGDTVRFAIIGDDDGLKAAIAGQKPQLISRFDIEIMAEPPLAASYVDIAIVKGLPKGFETLRTVFPSALVVWIATPEEMERIPPSAYVDDVWTAPIQARELAHRVALLVNRHIRKQRDDFYIEALSAAINNLPDIVWFKNNKGTHLKVNDAFCACVGKEKNDIEGYEHYHVWGLTQEEYQNSNYVCVDTDEIVNRTRKPGVFDELVMSARGLRQFKTYKSPILNAAGELLGTVGIARDITDLRNIDAKLKIVLDSVPFALLVTDETGRAIHTNPRFETIFRVRSESILGKPIEISDLVRVMSRKTINDGVEEELSILVEGNKIAQIVVQSADILDIFNNVVGNLNIYIDVTRSRTLDKKLKEMAYTDALTGLYTRHYLFHRLDGAVKADSMALLSIDLDNFKSVNDKYGHAAGDDLLKQVGTIMKETFPNALCVRLGGDEFLVAQIGGVDVERFTRTAKHLLDRLKDAFASEEYSRDVSSSGGIAVSASLQDEDFDSLLSKSDNALYLAKQRGKGHIVVHEPESV